MTRVYSPFMNTLLKFFAGAVVITIGAWSFLQLQEDTVVLEHPIGASSSSSIATPSSISTTTSSKAIDTPATPIQKPGSVRLKMDFASQAPTGNWDPPYDEACEEASLIIVRHYLEQTPLNADIMNRDILTMVAHEQSKGLPIDINMNQLAIVAQEMFGYTGTVVEGSDVTIERIEAELAQGNPVILPLAGQDIGNPYYTGEGPPYHVLVVVGYGSSGSPRATFTTHDVGTKRGEYYTYDQDVIMSAIHDWNGSVDTIRNGPKRMLVVTK